MGGGIDKLRQLVIRAAQLFIHFSRGSIAKDQHGPDDISILVLERRGAIVDRKFNPAFEMRFVCFVKRALFALPKSLLKGVVRGEAGDLIDDYDLVDCGCR